eukprot:SAG11_NODE_4225_length_2003_cov_1.109244_2_plen_116_part_00
MCRPHSVLGEPQILTFFLYLKSLNSGSVGCALLCSLSYFYMVAAWGGYVFIINLIPIHTLFLLFAGRFSGRLYITYSVFYAFGQILAMQVWRAILSHGQSVSTTRIASGRTGCAI